MVVVTRHPESLDPDHPIFNTDTAIMIATPNSTSSLPLKLTKKIQGVLPISETEIPIEDVIKKLNQQHKTKFGQPPLISIEAGPTLTQPLYEKLPSVVTHLLMSQCFGQIDERCTGTSFLNYPTVSKAFSLRGQFREKENGSRWEFSNFIQL